MEHSPVARRILTDVQAAHDALIVYTKAPETVCAAIRGIYSALAAGLDGLSDDQIVAAPSPDEWSMAEVLDHVAEHDRKYDEYRRLGLEHYVEHSLEHALQLWRLRLRT